MVAKSAFEGTCLSVFHILLTGVKTNNHNMGKQTCMCGGNAVPIQFILFLRVEKCIHLRIILNIIGRRVLHHCTSCRQQDLYNFLHETIAHNISLTQSRCMMLESPLHNCVVLHNMLCNFEMKN